MQVKVRTSKDDLKLYTSYLYVCIEGKQESIFTSSLINKKVLFANKHLKIIFKKILHSINITVYSKFKFLTCKHFMYIMQIFGNDL